jgi:hypothetical protein
LHFAFCILNSPQSDFRFRLLFCSCTLLFLLPVWLARFLPLVDLPQHLAFVNVLRNFRNPATDYSRMLSLHLFPQHNVLHLFLCYLLSFVVGIEGANRLFLTGYVILLPLAMLHLLNTLNARREFVFFSFLFIYNLNLLWGFMSTALAIPLVIFLLSFELRWLRRMTNPSSFIVHRSSFVLHLLPLLLLSILFILIFLGHSLMFLFAAALYLALVVAHHSSFIAHRSSLFLRRSLLALIPLVPVLAIFVIPWQAQVFGTENGSLLSTVLGGFQLTNLFSRPLDFIAATGFRADDVTSFLYKFLLVAAITLITVHAVRNRFKSLFQGRLLIPSLLVLLSLAGYLFFPGAVTQAWFLNQRFAVFIWLFVIPLAALLGTTPQFRGRETRGLSPVLALCILLSAGNTLYRFIAFDQETRPMARLISRLPPDRKVIGLPYELRPRHDLTGYDVFIHSGCYYQAFRRGYPGFSFAAFRYSPIQYLDVGATSQSRRDSFIQPGYEWSPWHFIFPDGWQFYDYFLVHGRPRPPTSDNLQQMKLVAAEGAWSVYQRPDSVAVR